MRTTTIFSFAIAILFKTTHSTLANSQPSPCPSAPTAWEQIHQTLHTYPIAIDSKSGPLFASVFAPDATANYTGSMSNLIGLDAIRDALLTTVSTAISQHQQGTTMITIAEDGLSANSTTYFTATIFSVVPATQGEYTVLIGLYDDELVDLEGIGWRINKRQLMFMTPSLGNLTQG